MYCANKPGGAVYVEPMVSSLAVNDYLNFDTSRSPLY